MKQMVPQYGGMPETIIKLHSERKDSRSLKNFASLLSSLAKGFTRSFILIDALNEHFTNEDEECGLKMSLLDELLHHRGNAFVYFLIFLTSRENLVLQEKLQGCVRAEIYVADTDI